MMLMLSSYATERRHRQMLPPPLIATAVADAYDAEAAMPRCAAADIFS